MTKDEMKELQRLQKESLDLVIKRSGVSKKKIIEVALKRFFVNNMDLLTAEEKKKYKRVIL